MATVKGDVHDIGKNIVDVVMQCNGYQVRDLGVMVDSETIVDTAQAGHYDIIGLSGLITPSLDEMIHVCQELQRRDMTTPVIVGGSTTSALHIAVKIALVYPDGMVIHAHSAADSATLARRLLAAGREEYIAELKNQQKLIRDNYLRKDDSSRLLTVEETRRRRHVNEPDTFHKTDFCVGVADYPEKHAESPNWLTDLGYLKQKVEAGAAYVATQICYDADKILRFRDACERVDIRVPILPGIKPFTTKAQLTILPQTFAVDLPQALVERVMACRDNNEVKKVGVEWAIQQGERLLKEGFPILHFYTMTRTTQI